VKSTAEGPQAPALAGRHGLSDATAKVARALLVAGVLTAGELAERLFLTPTAIRRHLDVLMERGYVAVSEDRPFGPTPPRGRGRPARFYTLTATGRDVFESSYDDVAVAALRFVADHFGDEAVTAFARDRAAELVARYGDVAQERTPASRVEALAAHLSDDGYAASATAGARGLQLCQHHCPVAHVAEEFPQLCEAEREAFAQLLGVHVTRLATIAAGDGICTALVPGHGLPSDTPHRTVAPSTERI
jgi:predicted ArsR family transcriptional regulator